MMNRYDKLEWLKETCSKDFIENHLMDEMVRWMGEDEFEKFYDHLCRCWCIAKTPEELNEQMGIVEEEEESEELSYTYKGVARA